MAFVKRSSASSPSSPTPKAVSGPAETQMIVSLSLPEEASDISNDINDYSLLIHGEPKIGKTSFVTQEEGVCLLTFDPVDKSKSLKQRFVPSWDHLEVYLALLEKRAVEGTYPYKRVVLDGADIMYRLCQMAVERRLGVSHVSDEKWGRGWDKLTDTFTPTVARFMALPGGCWFISHSEWSEEENHVGRKVKRLMPIMKSRAQDVIIGRVSGWFAYKYGGKNGRERLMVVRGDERIGAGTKIDGHFYTTDGREIFEIPMGNNSAQAYANFKLAFDNQQEFATLTERDGEKKGGEEEAVEEEPVEIPEE
jgi:hypothetical protein